MANKKSSNKKKKPAPPPKKKTTPPKNKKIAPPPKKKVASATMQWVVLIGVVVAAFGTFLFFQIKDSLDPGGTGVFTAEDWDLPALDTELDADGDGRVRLDEFSGTPTVVNFFASWCTACDAELPAFRETALALEGDVDFVFVNSNETGNWRGMAERNDITQFPLVQDIEGGARNGLYRSLRGTGGMPITAFYDAQGGLVDVQFTAFNESTLNGQLRQLGFIS